MAPPWAGARDGAAQGQKRHNGLRNEIRFLDFFHSFEPPSPLSEHRPYRRPKTTKTGLAAGLLNSNYQEGPLLESVAERERFELSRPLQAYGISSAAPSTGLGDRSTT